ncbi:hypothetical protein [Pseudomonas sp. NPDC007930]|uniref:GH39 family glycosyl hydrolase n=1 Tax=Pseudomonas sp. NPDC007930 TaxID=3364417 RepID=UPI0036E94E87
MTKSLIPSKRFNLATLACAALLSLASGARAEGFIVGVGTHLLNAPGDVTPAMDWAKNAGISSLRDDAWWAHVEMQPGVLQAPAEWGKYFAGQQTLGLDGVLILGYGNQFYNRDAKPVAQTVRNGFARYVDWVTQRLKGQAAFWEIYNEWDIAKPRMGVEADSKAYLKLVRDTAPQVRQNDPQARLLAGAITSEGIKKGFADRLVQGGVMQQVDGLSLHPYVHCEKRNDGYTPEHWIGWMREVSRHLDELNGGQPVPLYLTEMGWHSTADRHPCGVGADTQAAFLARSFLLARTLPAIKGMWWYDLVNDGTDPADQEHNFGLLNADLTPKPAYRVLKAISRLLREGELLQQQAGADGVQLLLFRLGNDHLLAAWKPGRSTEVQLNTDGPVAGPVRVLDTRQADAGVVSAPAQWQCQPQGCSVTLPLGEFPLLISLGQARLAAPTLSQD